MVNLIQLFNGVIIVLLDCLDVRLLHRIHRGGKPIIIDYKAVTLVKIEH